MSVSIKTYNPKEIVIALGSHIVTGLAEDSFISIEANGDGVTAKVGCDGEIVRSVNPDGTFGVKLVVNQYSATNTFLQNKLAMDRKNGEGLFPIIIKDLKGGMVFIADAAWAVKAAARGYGRESQNREWQLMTSEGTLTE